MADGARDILIVLQDFALGGTERIAVRLANAWAREGRRVTILCGEDLGPLGALLDADRVHVVPLGVARRKRVSPRLGRAAARWLAKSNQCSCVGRSPGSGRSQLDSSLRRSTPASSRMDHGSAPAPAPLVFVPGNFHWPVLASLAALRPRPLLVAQVSAAVVKPQRTGLGRWFYERRMRRLLGRADAVVTLSDSARAQALGIASRLAVTTIPLPALDDNVPAPTPASGRMVVAAGRLVPEKGFGELIEAFARVEDGHATLTIVGEGPDRARLEARVAALGLGERVALPGYAPDIRPWLDRARLFVLSSHYEGYAAVLVEALAAGRPVVATDCTPATHELLRDPRFGRVVPLGDVAALAAAIAATLGDPVPDPAPLAAAVARHRLGPVARDYLALFDALA